MIKNIFTIVLLVFLGGTVHAQQDNLKAKVENAEKFSANKEKGQFDFTMPENATPLTVNQKAAYYPEYFTVVYDQKTRNAKITMLEDVARSRQVMMRFMLSNGVKEITMNGKDYILSEFWEQYVVK